MLPVRLAFAMPLAVAGASVARAQPASTRAWRPEERTLVTDLSHVTAVAATDMVVYVATRQALAVYDRVGVFGLLILFVAGGNIIGALVHPFLMFFTRLLIAIS